MRNIRLFGKIIPLKDRDCGLNGKPGELREPSVNIFVKITDNCNAACPFCVFTNAAYTRFNNIKFINTLDTIRSQIKISKISFTGGEPTLQRDTLDLVLWGIHNLDPKINVTVNTNGFDLEAFPYDYINNMSLSKHHYDPGIDDVIFGHKTYKSEEINKMIASIPKEKLQLSCSVAKSGLYKTIDSTDEIYKYLTFYAGLGVYAFGFNSLMAVNDYCKSHYLNTLEMLDKLPNTRKSMSWLRPDKGCMCNNYVTATPSGLVTSYAKCNKDIAACDSILVFDVDKLMLGFGGEVIY
jgi:organic radical activating enzyme